MKIEQIDINKIKPYEKNAKLHPAEQIEQIKKSISEFGNNDPIAVDEDLIIIEGHGRYKALKELGYKKVDCIVLDGLSEEQKKAYRIAHNQLTMNTDWDMDILKEELNRISIDMSELGFDEDLLNSIEDEFTEIHEDDFNIDEALEDIDEPKSKSGDIYQLGNHVLMCGDSTSEEDLELLLDGDMVDLVLTDPPYNINISNSQGMTIENDNMNVNDFIDFLSNVFTNCNRSMKEGAVFYIWYADTSAKQFHEACTKVGWQVRENLIWVKSQFTLGRQDYQWRHEPCLYGWKDGAAHYFINDRKQSTIIDDSKTLETMTEDDLRAYIQSLLDTSTVLYEKKPLVNDNHPTMKPLKLMGKLIKNSSRKNDIVLDVFGGSGSTLMAAEQLGRRCRMMELDPKYVDVIINRWERETGQKAVLLN